MAGFVSDPAAAPPASAPPASARWGVAAVLLGTLVVPLDSAVNIDFPLITRHFALAIPQIQWIVISYTLTNASLMLICGRVADILGYRRVFLAGTAWSAVAFALCALAPSYPWLLAARVLQGIGAGLILSCGPALITAFYPETQRARALGLYTLGFGLGGALGPALGGVLIARFGWSAVFWARAPIAALGCLAGLMLPSPPRGGARESFDLPGAVLMVVTISALLLALNQIGHPARAAAALGFAVLAGAALVRREGRARHPIIDPRLFRLPGFAWVNLGFVAVNLAGFTVLLLAPFALARLPGLSTAAAGLVLAASPAGIMLAGPLAGRLAAAVPAATLMTAGAAVVALGLAAIALAGGGVPGLAAAMLVQGLGLGVFQVAYFDVVTGTIPLRDRGVAGSLGMLTRTLGLVAGASLLMTLFQGFRAAAAARGLGDAASFGAGFRGAFLCAAALAAAIVAVDLMRGLRRVGRG